MTDHERDEAELIVGTVIDTSDSVPLSINYRVFKTKVEAEAYALGVDDAAQAVDYTEMYGAILDYEPVSE